MLVETFTFCKINTHFFISNRCIPATKPHQRYLYLTLRAQHFLQRDHSFSTYVKLSEKLVFLTPNTHTYVSVSEERNVSFSENFVYVINERSQNMKDLLPFIKNNGWYSLDAWLMKTKFSISYFFPNKNNLNGFESIFAINLYVFSKTPN